MSTVESPVALAAATEARTNLIAATANVKKTEAKKTEAKKTEAKKTEAAPADKKKEEKKSFFKKLTHKLSNLI
ncbi:hypothetical protein DAKH74_044760 [Maudiozyma humilis]|uniref:Uncharacterized protein n=1 Tax=Maudiozyma humilis TaxID=51915 RepID=A0AAV5S2G5_MAUHU|nr:hypothetical protein DAKH74_044760 [Kazachstania humilis]